MAKNAKKKPTFGVMDNLSTPVYTHTHTDTHDDMPTHESTHEHTQKRERKTRRVQLLLTESAVNNLDAFAKDHDLSRNEIIQGLIEDFLKMKGV